MPITARRNNISLMSPPSPVGSGHLPAAIPIQFGVGMRSADGSANGDEDIDRLSLLEDNVRSLSSTLEELKKQLGVRKRPAQSPSVPQPAAAPAPTTPRRGRKVSSQQQPQQQQQQQQQQPTQQMILSSHEYSKEEAIVIGERHTRAVRGLKLITGPELGRLCDYVHPPSEILPYIKIVSLMLKLGHKKLWTEAELKSDRKELWGMGWRELRSKLNKKGFLDKLVSLVPKDVGDDVRFVMDFHLTDDEVKPELGRVSYAATALAEFIHSFHGLYKLERGVKLQEVIVQPPPPPAPTNPTTPSSNQRRRRSRSRIEVISPPMGSVAPQPASEKKQPSVPRSRCISPVVKKKEVSKVEKKPREEILKVASPIAEPIKSAPVKQQEGDDPVVGWLHTLGLSQYAGVFRMNEVDIDTLGLLTDKDLEDMGLPIGPKKKILHALESPFQEASFQRRL